MSIIPICGVCGQYFARKELGCPNCSAKEEEQNRINKLELDYQSKREELIKLKDFHKKDLNELTTTLATLEKKSTEINTAVSSHESQLKVLTTDLETAGRTILSLESEIKSLLASYNTKIQQRDELASKLVAITSKEQDLKKQLEKRKNELENLRLQKLEENQRAISAAKDEKSKAEAEYKKIELAYIENEKNIEATRLAKEQFERILSQQKNFVLSPTQISAIKNEKQLFENELKSTSDMLTRMQREFDTQNESNSGAIIRLKINESELSKLEESFNDLRTKKHQIESQLNIAADRLNILAVQAHDFTAKIEEMKSNLSKFTTQKQTSEMKTKITEIHNLISSAELELSKLVETRNNQKVIVQDLESQLNNLQQTSKSFETEIIQKQVDIEKLKAVVNNAQAQSKEVTADLARTNAIYTNLEGKIKELDEKLKRAETAAIEDTQKLSDTENNLADAEQRLSEALNHKEIIEQSLLLAKKNLDEAIRKAQVIEEV